MVTTFSSCFSRFEALPGRFGTFQSTRCSETRCAELDERKGTLGQASISGADSERAESAYLALHPDQASEARRLQLLGETYDAISVGRLARLGLRRGARCIDVGAGSGSVALALASLVGLEGRVTATDLNPETFCVEAPNVRFERHDVTRELLAKSAFDLVYSRGVVGLLPQRDAVLRSMVAATAPGGWVVIETFDFGPIEDSGPKELTAIWRAMLIGGPQVDAEVNWMARLPIELEHAGARPVQAESTTPIIRTGSPSADYWAQSLELVRGFLEPALLREGSIDAAKAYLKDAGDWVAVPALTYCAASVSSGQRSGGPSHKEAVRVGSLG